MIKSSQNIKMNPKKLFFIAILALVMFSCGNKQYRSTCTYPSGVNLEEALAHSRKDLQRLECEQMFDGYYDRLLEKVRPECALVAPCYESQLFDDLIVGPHDVFMDLVVTEAATYAGRGRS